MMIRPSFDSKLQEKRKLSIANPNSSSPKPILKISDSIKENYRTSLFKPSDRKLSEEIDSKKESKEKEHRSLRKENLSIKKHNSRCNSEEKCEEPKILRPSLKHIRNEISMITFPLIEPKTQKDGQERVSLEGKRSENKRLVLSQLMSTSSNKGEDFKDKKEEVSPNKNLEQKKLPYLRRSQTDKKSNRLMIEKVKDELLENVITIDSQSINQTSQCESVNEENQRAKKLNYDFLNIEIVIPPSAKPEKIDIEVQAIQEEREYFDYLKYKRRKKEFENELENLFTEISIVKNDRVICETRMRKLKEFESKSPENEREERVFKIKNEILEQEIKIQKLFVEKLTSVENYLSEIGRLDLMLLKDSENFLTSFKTTFKVNPKDQEINVHEFIENSYLKMEHCLKTFLKESMRKIQTIIEHKKPSKIDFMEPLSVFNEYKNTILEQKELLKNCFSHIKKVPELCYELCGNELPSMDGKQFRDENNEFAMPKCMDCFNSEWKLHLIIEKNIVMESIFKVTEELLR